MGAPVLLKFQTAPKTQAHNILWVQEKEPNYYCISKPPVNERPSRLPNGAPMERVARFQILHLHISGALLHLSLKVSSK